MKVMSRRSATILTGGGDFYASGRGGGRNSPTIRVPILRYSYSIWYTNTFNVHTKVHDNYVIIL